MQVAINLCNSQKIDLEKWNDCIAKNANGLIYAQYQYLSFLTKNWSAIIIDDYEAVMPLPWNSKWGIKYYQAIPFIQQLGLIGKIDQRLFPVVLKRVVEFAKYGDIFFNFSNQELVNTIRTDAKTNLVLDLNQDYSYISNQYHKDLIHNLEKAKKYHPIYVENSNYLDTLQIYKHQYGKRFHWISESDFQQLSKTLTFYQSKQQCLVRTLIDQTTEELLASAILLMDKKRLYLLINAITPRGRQQSSNHLLIDKIINEFSGTDLLLDFEGSEIKGVKDFYMNYNPMVQPYFHYHHNQLRWPINLLKR